MKRALLASTAIVAAAALASPANAADRIKLSLGGFMEQYIGFADNEEDTGARDFATFDQQSDNEIYFSGSTTLDNGIKMAVRVELEGETGTGAAGAFAGVDEAWLDIQTAWGSIRLGQEDVMADLQAVEPQKGISNDADNWIPEVGMTLNDDSYSVGGSGDDNQIHYLSPKIWGFQAGASYTPEIGNNSNVQPNRVGDASSGLSATLNWTGKFADIGIETGYAYYSQGGDGSSVTTGFVAHQAGLNVTFNGFGLGGAYGRHMGQKNIANDDATIYKVGVWYGTGPILVGFLHRNETNEGGLTGTSSGGREDEATTNSVFFNYTISDGVKWESMIFHADYDEETGVDAAENNGGWGVVGGIRLDF